MLVIFCLKGTHQHRGKISLTVDSRGEAEGNQLVIFSQGADVFTRGRRNHEHFNGFFNLSLLNKSGDHFLSLVLAYLQLRNWLSLTFCDSNKTVGIGGKNQLIFSPDSLPCERFFAEKCANGKDLGEKIIGPLGKNLELKLKKKI